MVRTVPDKDCKIAQFEQLSQDIPFSCDVKCFVERRQQKFWKLESFKSMLINPYAWIIPADACVHHLWVRILTQCMRNCVFSTCMLSPSMLSTICLLELPAANTQGHRYAIRVYATVLYGSDLFFHSWLSTVPIGKVSCANVLRQ